MRRTLLAVLPLLLAALASPAPAQQRTAESLLADLTLEQRIAQLIMCWSLTRDDAAYPRRDELRRWVEDQEIGGVILSLGDVETAAKVVTDLQGRAKVPLLMAGDFEGGLSFRLQGATDLGKPMLWGATGSSELSEAAGRITGLECRALGFQWSFAPVLDVNVNPANPIINVRSLGEDPQAVARLGAAFVRGCEATGVLSTGKHFPGHGDVDTDSHLALPTVPGDRARLDAVELVPFRAAIAAGMSSIMTGHLAVPGLGTPADLPATLSPAILTGLLREELGFAGLIVTDALDMGALHEDPDAPDPALPALLAGADILLMPKDPQATIDAVAKAVRDGTVPAARVDDAALRVLRAKLRTGLYETGGKPRDDWREIVACDAHREVAAKIARAGLTLMRDPRGLVPLAHSGRPQPLRRVELLVLAPSAEPETAAPVRDALAEAGLEVAVHAIGSDASTADQRRLAADLARSVRGDDDTALVSLLFHRADRARRPLTGLDTLLAGLAAIPRHVGVLFGDPYAVGHVHPDGALLQIFHGSEATVAAVADALSGKAAITGRMPITVPGQCAAGDGLSWYPPAKDLVRATPAAQGFDPRLPDALREVLARGIENRAFPGAVATIARRGVVVAEVAAGRTTWADGPYRSISRPMQVDALFDMASLTKVCATTPTILRLVDRGALDLDAPIAPRIAGFDDPRVTTQHLLTHTAGFPPFLRFFRDHHGAYAVLHAAVRTPLVTAPGAATKYSDIGLMCAMLVAEHAGQQPFAALTGTEVFEPLGMQSAQFASGTSPLDAVPTEARAWPDGSLVVGRAHDENAAAMGGVSGHAGLFATAADVTRLGQAFLGGGRGWLSPALARAATRPAEVVAGSSRAIGWDTFRAGGSGGSKLSARAFGHTGYTGTSIWCDPRTDVSIVLLTNRVHPTRENSGHVAVRRELADRVVDLLVDTVPEPAAR